MIMRGILKKMNYNRLKWLCAKTEAREMPLNSFESRFLVNMKAKLIIFKDYPDELSLSVEQSTVFERIASG